MKGNKKVFFLLFFGLSLGGFSQSTSSVYSDRGIGILNYQGLPNNMGMGEVGIGTPSTWSLNYQNPAFMPLNSLTVFQVGIEMDRRTVTNNQESLSVPSGGLRFLNFSFPIISGKWTSGFGIAPYSTVNYETFSVDSLNNNQTASVQNVSGSGGLNSLTWSNGVKLGDNLYLGLKNTFLFGTVNDRVRSFLIDENNSEFVVDFLDESNLSGSTWELSAGYRKPLSDERVLNLGLVYQRSFDITGKNDKRFETLDATGFVILTNDLVTNQDLAFSMPSYIGFGTSYQILNKFMLGLDVKSTNWSSAGSSTDDFINTTKWSFGAQWIPDYSSVNSYWKRASYRIGFNFDKLPYKVSDQTIREFGINFGSSLPVGLSSLDFAFKYGILGTTDNDLIRENYFKIVIGATINDRWFVKRRYD